VCIWVRESANIQLSGQQGVAVSDSSYSYKLTSSRDKPVKGRQQYRTVQKVKVVKKPQPAPQKVNPTIDATGVRVKRIPKSQPPRVGPVVSSSTARMASKTTGQIPPFNPNIVKVKSVKVRKQPLPRRTVSSRKTRLKPMARNILYGLRLLIVGVGIGAIVGTVLSVLDPATRLGSATSAVGIEQGQLQATQTPITPNSGLLLTQEISGLKTAIQSIASTSPSLTPGVFVVDLENGSYVDINATATFPSASTIKIPILVAFFQEVDAGRIRLDETMTTKPEHIAGGSGDMQSRPVGTTYSALEVASKMIIISDNTATNMLIERLGGMSALNQRFRSWGLSATAISNLLPDLQGTNTTSPKELGSLLAMVSKGNLISMTSRDRMFDIMRRTVKDSLLPSGLGQGAIIAHKTGDIGAMVADAGIIDLPIGKRYLAAVMVQRPNNDVSAERLIGSISRAAYQQFSQTAPMGSNTIPGNSPHPVMAPPLSNSIPVTGYQSPAMNPVPPTGYQSPVVTPQYYYPYQR
jgi:beta-lactamase class A